ncbi:hypothetical protein NUACC21_80660 [Scytonema sp. NUACC21]
MAHSNIAIVEKMYQSLGKGDLETLRNEVFTADVVWKLPGHHPLSGTMQGIDEVLAFFRKLGTSGLQAEVIKIDAINEDTVTEVHRVYGESKGVSMNILTCTHYQIRNNKIAQVEDYIHNQAVADRYFWANYSLKSIPERLAS